MKKRKFKNTADNKNKNKKIIIIVTIIILIAILFFATRRFTGQVVGQVIGEITGDATSTALYNCTDSDNNLNYFERGVCKDRKQQYTDACYSRKGLGEYYCGRDKYACIMQETACPFGCMDGRCLKKGEIVAESSETNASTEINVSLEDNPIVREEDSPNAETVKNSYLNIIVSVLVIIILIFLGWVLFRKRTIRVKKNSIKLNWK